MKIEGGVPGLKNERGGESVMDIDDLDNLLAEADRAAEVAKLEAKSSEIKTAQTGRKKSAKKAEGVEGVQRRFASLSAEDKGVEGYAWDWILSAAEDQTMVAAPEGVMEKIKALRKIGPALKRFEAIEPKTKELLDNIKKLQEMRAELFPEVQEAAMNALEMVKGKFKGEENKYGKQYDSLRTVDNSENGETREKALKQEIDELFFKPLNDIRLAGLEQEVVEAKKRLVLLQEAQAEKYYWEKETDRNSDHQATQEAIKLGLISPTTTISSWSFRSDLSKAVKETQPKFIKNLETQLVRERLSLEMNRLVVNEVLNDEHDENNLKDCFVALRTYLQGFRNFDFQGGRLLPRLDNELAIKILGRLEVYGVAIPGRNGSNYGNNRNTDQLSVGGQLVLLGEKSYFISRNQAEERLQSTMETSSRTGFLRQQLPIYNEETQSDLLIGSNRGFDITTPAVLSALLKRSKVPDADKVVGQAFAGQSKLWNLRQAYRKVDDSLRGKKQFGESEEPKITPPAGWKESKLGALIEPKGDTRQVDREFSKMIEHFSEPLADAEYAFDLRGLDGELPAPLTLDGAKRQLSRSRRDTMTALSKSEKLGGIIQELERKIEGGTIEGGKKVGGLEQQIKTLQEKLDTSQEALRKAREEREVDKQSAGDVIREANRTISLEQARSKELAKKLVNVLKAVQFAIDAERPTFGGEKALKKDLKALLEQMEGK